MARLNTTTYQSRSDENLKRLKHFVDIEVKTILEIGPGGVLKLFGPLLNGSFIGRLVKGVEQPLRRFSFLDLESFEPFEIYDTFKESSPELTVVDIHTRTLNGIEKKSAGKHNIKTQLHDIAEGAFPGKTFDVIVCNAVINWDSQDYKSMIDNVVKSLNVGGYLLLTTKFKEYLDNKEELERLEQDIYKRVR